MPSIQLNRMQAIALTLAIAAVVISQAYYASALTAYNHDFSDIIYGVFVPLIFGVVLLTLTRQYVLVSGFASMLLSVVDDVPVLFDWPRLTGFPSGVAHNDMQIYIYELSVVLLVISFVTLVMQARPTWRRTSVTLLLYSLVFIVSFADDIPIDSISNFVDQSWYSIYFAEHVASVVLLVLAISVANGRGIPGSARAAQPKESDVVYTR